MRTMDDDDDEDDDDFEYEESELEDAESLPGDEGMAEVASDGVAYQRAHQPFAAPMQRSVCDTLCGSACLHLAAAR